MFLRVGTVIFGGKSKKWGQYEGNRSIKKPEKNQYFFKIDKRPSITHLKRVKQMSICYCALNKTLKDPLRLILSDKIKFYQIFAPETTIFHG